MSLLRRVTVKEHENYMIWKSCWTPVCLNKYKLRNNSWKPYLYIVFTTGRFLCHEVLPRA